ncbi:hypothetical protein JW752_04205 [Candidatus Peregrinibacteria bacterium]|nr:hypothetical protein [Candidatus Peregrinibacteria bacterium]
MRLHPLLFNWLEKKKITLKKGKWVVTQKHKEAPYKIYKVGKVIDFVYAHEHPEYLHMILKIKGNPKDWKTAYAFKLTYMTITEKGDRVVNGQRPIVSGGGCFRELMRKAKKKEFF